MNLKAIVVRVPAPIVAEIDALAGKQRRAHFIRNAILNEIEQARERLLLDLELSQTAAPVTSTNDR